MAAKYPAIIHPTEKTLMDAIVSIKEAIEIGQRIRGGADDSWARYSEYAEVKALLDVVEGKKYGAYVNNVVTMASSTLPAATYNMLPSDNVIIGDADTAHLQLYLQPGEENRIVTVKNIDPSGLYHVQVYPNTGTTDQIEDHTGSVGVTAHNVQSTVVVRFVFEHNSNTWYAL